MYESIHEGLAQAYEDLLRGNFERWQTYVEEIIQPGPSANGFAGFLAIADEFAWPMSVWHHLERPKTFTPAQFNKLWESFSEARKVEYVLSLIS